MKVDEIIKKLKAGQLDSPDELANFLVILSASIYEAGQLETEAEIKYNAEWIKIKESQEKITDKLADSKAKQTKEYREWQQLKHASLAIIETIRALKHKLKNLQNEFQSGQNY